MVTLLPFWGSGQEIIVKGGFIEDSLFIGQNINFWLSASYPPSLEMVFPDSNATFSPFEYSDKQFFKTELKNGMAFDSTIYTLQSFEIDPIQYLQLSAVILNGKDSTIIKTPLDSIYFTELAPAVSDTTQLKTNTNYQAIRTQFNYPLLYYILGGLFLLVLILLLIFGKRIVKFFKVRKLQKEHRKFSETFTLFLKRIKSDPKPEIAEDALSIWKSYLESLDKVTFSTLTTKEILSYDFAKELEKPLKSIDRMVYGKGIQEKIYQDFQQIEDFAFERFTKRIEEIKHGK